jgi:hypothetical protein
VVGTEDVTAEEHRGVARRLVRGLMAFLLGGVNAMELLALTIGFLAVVGLLWATDRVAPETLVTDRWLRAAWAVAVIGVLRPLTWIPYVLAFAGLRQLGRWIAPRANRVLVNALANLGVLAILALAIAVAGRALGTAARWTESVLGFLTGTVGFSGLGTDTGTWDASRIAAVVAVLVLVRPVVPPLDTRLDLAPLPILGFVEGGRGRFDRWLTGVAAVLALIAGAVVGVVALQGG